MVQEIQSTNHFDGANVTVSLDPVSLVLTKAVRFSQTRSGSFRHYRSDNRRIGSVSRGNSRRMRQREPLVANSS
jgi:hypothetical protein